MEDYNKQIARRIMKSNFKMIDNIPQPDSLATFERAKMYGGKRVRAHPLAGYTAYSEEPSSLTVTGPTLLNRTFNKNLQEADSESDEDDPEIKMGGMRKPGQRLTNAIKQRILSQHPELMEIHLSGGAINWKEIWNNIKKGASFVKKAAPIISSLAPEEYRDMINKTGDISGIISGMGRTKKPRGRPKKHYVHHDVRLVEPVERHHKLDGSGFWKDFGQGFKTGFKGANKVASKVLPIASIFQPELAPLAAASVAANAAMGGRRKRKCIGGASELYPPAVMKGGKKPSARGLLIKKVMAQRKCSLPEASKYIKEHNLM